MPVPTDDLVTTALDQGTDTPPRAEFLKLFNRFKEFIACVGGALGVCELDASSLVPSSRIPDLAASKITSGTLPVARGGTGGGTASAARSALGLGNISSAGSVTTVTGEASVTGAIKEGTFVITDGASVDINPANGTIQHWTLGANRSPTAANFADGHSVLLGIDDGTAFTITWPSVVWVGGSAPVLETSGYTWIELWKSGGVLRGALVGSTAS